jgi:hypothetical protein
VREIALVASIIAIAGGPMPQQVPVSANNTLVPAGPLTAETWSGCADENGICYVVGTAHVRYGANDHWAVKTVTGSISCGNATFGDPIYGTLKHCETDGKVGAAPAPPPILIPRSTAIRRSTTTTFPALAASDTIFGLPDIPSEFDVSAGLQKAWGSGAIPASGKPDDVGAFRFICGPGQVLADDPIMYPGQPGKSHLHQFYGNTDANAYSTYATLRRNTGPNTCNNSLHVLNRSAYWMPALLDGKGNVVRPDYVSIYYKRRPLSDPTVSDPKSPKFMGFGLPLPNGLRFIFGRDMMNLAARPTGNFHYLCQTPEGAQVTPSSISMDKVLAACPAGDQFAAVVDAPHCWDGKNLDSADHRSHVAYPSYGSWGYLRCDPGHPYVIPTFTLGARWTIAATDDTSKWIFSSDVAMSQPRGTTFHADWFGAWDNQALSMWTANAIDGLLSASGGDLGNGWQLKGAAIGDNGFGAQGRVLPLAQVPQTPVH